MRAHQSGVSPFGETTGGRPPGPTWNRSPSPRSKHLACNFGRMLSGRASACVLRDFLAEFAAAAGLRNVALKIFLAVLTPLTSGTFSDVMALCSAIFAPLISGVFFFAPTKFRFM